MLYTYNDENIFLVPSAFEQEITGLINFGYNDFAIVKPVELMHTSIYDSLHIVLDGCGTYEINNRTYNVKCGDMFFIPMNVMMRYPPDKELPWKYVWFSFTPNFIAKYMPLLEINVQEPVKKLNNFEQVSAIMFDAIKNCKASGELSVYSCMALFMQFLALEGKAAKTIKDPKQMYLESIKAYIESNYTSPDFTVDMLCGMMHLSHSYICRIFSEAEGSTIVNYVEALRLSHAAKLLLDTNLNVNQIAPLVGYRDHLHFMKRFKKKYGITAIEYRYNGR